MIQTNILASFSYMFTEINIHGKLYMENICYAKPKTITYRNKLFPFA